MVYFNKKISGVILCVVAVLLFIPQTTNAAEKTDPRCWAKAACDTARAGFGTKSGPDDKGFVVNAETKKVCGQDENGQDIGFCLPITQTTTNIGFGGKRNFANIGEFIVEMFRYGIIVAGILSVIMIIFAGFQWTISGGGENIKKAQERIGGAVIGLVIALLSYTILNTINPMLVNFRLPQSWLINTQLTTNATYCTQLEPDVRVAPLGAGDAINPDPKAYKFSYQELEPTNTIEKLFPKKNTTLSDETHVATQCGKKYSIFSTTNTCLGLNCPINSVCVDDLACEEWFKGGTGGIAGTIAYSPGKYIDDDMWLYVVCGETPNYSTDWTIEEIDTFEAGDDVNKYVFRNVAADGATECNGEANVKGYFFIMEINDPNSPIATADDQWMGGRTFCTNYGSQNSCGMLGASLITTFGAGAINVTENIATVGLKLHADAIDANNWLGLLYTEQHLFTQEEVKNGFLCNFNITETSMPVVGSGPGDVVADVAKKAYFAAQGINAILLDEFLGLTGGASIYYGGVGYACPQAKNATKNFKDKLKELIEKNKKL